MKTETKKQTKLKNRIAAWNQIMPALQELPKDDRHMVIAAILIIFDSQLAELDGLFIACCDACGQFALFPSGQWPAGWVQSGRSRYGKRYQKSGLAWHCPKHKRGT